MYVRVDGDRAISAYELPRDEVFAIPDIIRTATNLLPPTIEVVRIVDIDGLDVQADGGTHVASTRQVGRMRVVKVENKGKGFRRIRVALRAERTPSNPLRAGDAQMSRTWSTNVVPYHSSVGPRRVMPSRVRTRPSTARRRDRPRRAAASPRAAARAR